MKVFRRLRARQTVAASEVHLQECKECQGLTALSERTLEIRMNGGTWVKFQVSGQVCVECVAKALTVAAAEFRYRADSRRKNEAIAASKEKP